jgi:FkbM family methyltransferase
MVHYPYTRHYDILGTAFDYWIADETARRWYDVEVAKNYVELGLIKDLVCGSDSILEIGVHYGFHATFMNQNLSELGRYHGVEIHPKCVMYTQAQFALNCVPVTRNIMNAAAGAGAKNLYYTPHHHGNATVSTSETGSIIQAVTGDSLLKMLGEVTFLKIDVEGYEIQVLSGCQEILRSSPKLALEIHGPMMGRFGNSLSQLFDLIDFREYEGQMYIRPDDSVIRFDPAILRQSADAIANIYLTPKRPVMR